MIRTTPPPRRLAGWSAFVGLRIRWICIEVAMNWLRSATPTDYFEPYSGLIAAAVSTNSSCRRSAEPARRCAGHSAVRHYGPSTKMTGRNSTRRRGRRVRGSLSAIMGCNLRVTVWTHCCQRWCSSCSWLNATGHLRASSRAPTQDANGSSGTPRAQARVAGARCVYAAGKTSRDATAHGARRTATE